MNIYNYKIINYFINLDRFPFGIMVFVFSFKNEIGNLYVNSCFIFS